MVLLKAVDIFTDGACSGNPGAGGCAAILVHGKHRTEIAVGFRWTTNNRMEMMALILGLEAMKYKCIISIHSDSRYLLGAFKEGWLERWKATGWRTKARGDVMNIDLWKRLDELLSLHHPKFKWVRGHSGHPENTRCDKLAVEAAKGADLQIDSGFEEANPFPDDQKKVNNQIQGTGDPLRGSPAPDL